MRIVFMGTPDFASGILEAILNDGSHQVAGVVTVADKAVGRGMKVQKSSVKICAEKHDLLILQPEKLRDEQFIAQLKSLQADVFVVVAFRMLPEVVWKIPTKGTINLHASLLPQYRGAAPINWAIINGETKTGVTTFMLNAEIDKGAVIGRREVPIDEVETAGVLHDKLMMVGTELVLESVDKIASGTAVPIDQSRLEIAHLKEAPKIHKETCRIDWDRPVETVYNLIRGLSPYPAAWTELIDAESRTAQLKIFRASKQQIAPDQPPGTILSDCKTILRVACRDGFIDVEELQAAGKKRMSTADFLRGFNGEIARLK